MVSNGSITVGRDLEGNGRGLTPALFPNIQGCTEENYGNHQWAELFSPAGNQTGRLQDNRFEVFTAVTMKNAVFWDVTVWLL
jgi:hypothetical protein